MQTVDWLALGIILLSALIGLMLGFGKSLKLFTGGIFGIIIAVVITYFCFGVVASWGFVQDIMAKFSESMNNSGSKFVNFLGRIGIEKVVLAVGLCIVIQILRIIIVSIIKNIVEIDNPIVRAINRIVGMLFMLAIMVMLTLIIFHIIYWVGGGTRESFETYLSGSAFKIDRLFENNPLRAIFEKPGYKG